MTQLLVPGLVTGSAPPANGPPGLSPPGQTGKTTDPKDKVASFAALLTAAKAATQGGETAPPPAGGTPSMPDDTSDAADLLAVLFALMQGIEADEGRPTETTSDLSLLDRPAGAGEGNEALNQVLDDLEPGAAEALMALLMMGGAQLPSTEALAMPSLDADVRDVLAAAEAALAGVTSEVEPAPQGPAIAPGTAATDEMIPQGAVALAGDEVAEAGDDALTQSAAALADAPATSADESVAAAAAVAALEERSGIEGEAGAEEPAVSELVSGRNGARELPEQRIQPVAQRTMESNVNPQAEANAAGAVNVSQPNVGASAPTQATTNAQRMVNANALPEAVADMVQGAVLRGDSEVRLVLNPPDLGHLDIRIATTEGGLRIQVEASQSGARDLIERALPALQQGLEARDLRVDRLEVRATDTGRGSMDSTGAGQQDGQQGQTDGRDGGPEWSAVAAFQQGQAGDTDAVTPSQQGAVSDGHLDVLA